MGGWSHDVSYNSFFFVNGEMVSISLPTSRSTSTPVVTGNFGGGGHGFRICRGKEPIRGCGDVGGHIGSRGKGGGSQNGGHAGRDHVYGLMLTDPARLLKNQVSSSLCERKKAECRNCLVWSKCDFWGRDVIKLTRDVEVGYIVMINLSTGRRTKILRMKDANVIGVYHPLIDEQLVQISHGKSKKVYAWTVNDFGNEDALVRHETNIPYADWGPGGSRSLSLIYSPSEVVKHNGFLYADDFFARSGYTPDPTDPEYWTHAVFGKTHPIIAHLPKSKADKKRSLLQNAIANDEEQIQEVIDETVADSNDGGLTEWVSYWKPNVTINLVDDFTRYSHDTIPPNIAGYMNIDMNVKGYYPAVFLNEFCLLRDKLILLNESATELLLHLELGPISMTKWQLFLQIDQSFQMQRSYGSMLEGEAVELKMVFLEENPYLLGITVMVSMLHSVFDFLAFKNDTQFWNKNKSMEGFSAKTVVVSFISQLIVFLNLLDNDTSWMIIASSGVGCCIEFWKIGKTMHVEIDRNGKIPMKRFRDRESYAKNKTKEYDDLGMKYLPIICFFLRCRILRGVFSHV